jgi:hypothetical protein
VEEEDAEKAAGGALKKALDRNDTLEKAINAALPIIDDLQKRMKAIEDMPKPRPMDMVVKAVSKDEDGSVAQLTKLAQDNPEAVGMALIKLAQQQPRQMLPSR